MTNLFKIRYERHWPDKNDWVNVDGHAGSHNYLESAIRMAKSRHRLTKKHYRIFDDTNKQCFEIGGE
jgi:hypothetical protein